MVERTPEQAEREAILYDLLEAVQRGRQDARGLLWLHFTDWHGSFNLPRLEKEGLLILNRWQVYAPDGTWRDHFPPDAYTVTSKALAIMENRAQWVFDGGVVDAAKWALEAARKRWRKREGAG